MPDELPAVTVALSSVAKTGLSFASFWGVVSGRGCSSVSTTSGSALRRGTLTATISASKRHAALAAAHFSWLAMANAS